MSDKKDNNKEKIVIRVNEDKRGKSHINIYDKDPQDPTHKSIHINIDKNTDKGNIVDTTNGSKETTDVGCFLTTACMKNKGVNFVDDCEELSVLRWFRNNFVSSFDTEHYYTTAPIIVEAISKCEDENEIYEKIYNSVIVSCVNLIKKEEYNQAYNIYRACVLTLEERYARNLVTDRLVKTLKLI